MLDQASSTEYERDLARLRELRQAVLLYLMGAGPTIWDTLYVRVRQHKTDEIAHTLRSLARWNHISVEADSTTRIIASGANQLQHCSA